MMIKAVVPMRISIEFIWFGIRGSAVEGGRARETHQTIITRGASMDG